MFNRRGGQYRPGFIAMNMSELTVFTMRKPGRLTLLVHTQKGRSECVRFEPVTTFGRLGDGEFVTGDEELSGGLKKHSAFGVDFFLKSEPAKKKQSPTKEPPEKECDLRSLLPDPANAIEEPTVTSVQMANNWLQKNHGCVFEAKKDSEIKAEAARKYNVIFVNW